MGSATDPNITTAVMKLALSVLLFAAVALAAPRENGAAEDRPRLVPHEAGSDGNSIGLWEVLKTVISIAITLYQAFGSGQPSTRDDFVPELFSRLIELDRAYTGYYENTKPGPKARVAYRAAPAIAASSPVA